MSFREINSRSLWKILLYGSAGLYGPFSTFCGVFSLLHIVPARMNDKEYYGVQGLAIYVLFSPFVVLILTASSWLFLAPGWKLARFVLNRFSSADTVA